MYAAKQKHPTYMKKKIDVIIRCNIKFLWNNTTGKIGEEARGLFYREFQRTTGD